MQEIPRCGKESKTGTAAPSSHLCQVRASPCDSPGGWHREHWPPAILCSKNVRRSQEFLPHSIGAGCTKTWGEKSEARQNSAPNPIGGHCSANHHCSHPTCWCHYQHPAQAHCSDAIHAVTSPLHHPSEGDVRRANQTSCCEYKPTFS